MILMVALMIPMVMAIGSSSKLARDAGWKRVFPGVYLKGPNGGPYVQQDAGARDADGSIAGRQKTRNAKWPLLALALFLPVVLPVAGALIFVNEGHPALAGVLTGFLALALIIGCVWIALSIHAATGEMRRRSSQ